MRFQISTFNHKKFVCFNIFLKSSFDYKTYRYSCYPVIHPMNATISCHWRRLSWFPRPYLLLQDVSESILSGDVVDSSICDHGCRKDFFQGLGTRTFFKKFSRGV